MKGKLVLTPITKPVEGMQVVWGGDTEGLNPLTIDVIQQINVEFNDFSGMVALKGMYLLPFRLQDLKQIVVEYVTRVNHNDFDSTDVLPLHPSDWEWALQHIGEEVEFTIAKYVAGFKDGKQTITDGDVASLIIAPVEETWDDITKQFDGNLEAFVKYAKIYLHPPKHK